MQRIFSGLRAAGPSALGRARQPVATPLFATSRRWLAASGAIVEVPVPAMGDSITEGTVLSLAKKAGDYIAMEEVFAEIETDKVTVDVRSPEAGTIETIHVEEGATVEVGGKFYSLAVGVGAPDAAAAAPAAAPAAAAPAAAPAATPAPAAAPAAAAAPPPPKPAAAAPPPPPKPAAAPAAPSGSRETRVAMTRIRKRTAQRLLESQETTASLTTFNEIDMTAISEMRKKYQEMFVKKHDIKLGFMSPFVAAACKVR